MKVLATYLWKEWREQRATLLVLAAVMLAGVVAVSSALPRAALGDPLAFQGIVAFTLIATAISLGSDLLARERQSGTIAFLDRLPAGLEAAFRGKLGFLAASLLCAGVYGVLLAAGAAWIRGGALAPGLLDGSAAWALGAFVFLSLWVFSVSAWIPGSALAFPATLMLLAACAWPAVASVMSAPRSSPTPWQALLFGVLCVAGAPASAWASFVVGSRLGRTRRVAAFAGLSVAAICFLPSWVWAAARYLEHASAPFEIRHGWVGSGGRYLFLDLARREPAGAQAANDARGQRSSALVLDLQTGSWSPLGAVDSSAVLPHKDFFRREAWLGSVPCARFRLLGEGGQERILDGATARELPATEAGMPPAPQPTPSDFGLEREPRTYSIRPAGLGQMLVFQREGENVALYRDPASGTVVDAATLPGAGGAGALIDVRIRPGRWLARRERTRDWVWLEPLTCQSGCLESVGRGEQVGPSVDDGRIVVVSHGQAVLVDPDSGRREGIHGDSTERLEVRGLTHGANGSLPVSSAEPAFVYLSARGFSGLAMLDLGSRTLRPVAPSGHHPVRLLHATGQRALVLEEGERIVRYDLERKDREVLFSVDSVR